MLAVVWRLLGVVVFFVLFLEFCRNSNEKILIPWVCHSKRFEKLYALVCDIIRMVKSWLSLSVYFTVFCELDRLCRSNPDRVKRDETFYRSAQWRLSNENANTNKTIGSISSTVSIGWRNVADACVWNLTVLLSAVSSEIPIFVLFLSLRCISVDNGLLPHYSFRFQLNSSGYNINSHYQLHCTFSIHSYWNYDSFVFIFIFILFVHIVLRHSVRLLFFFFFLFRFTENPFNNALCGYETLRIFAHWICSQPSVALVYASVNNFTINLHRFFVFVFFFFSFPRHSSFCLSVKRKNMKQKLCVFRKCAELVQHTLHGLDIIIFVCLLLLLLSCKMESGRCVAFYFVKSFVDNTHKSELYAKKNG